MIIDIWPFEQPRNLAVFATREVVQGGEPILRVTHDPDDGSWQFIGPTGANSKNGMVIALAEAVEIDPSLLELADLPVGWHAVRHSREKPWNRLRVPVG